MQKISINQELKSGSKVKFLVGGYMVEQNESDIFEMTVPKYPRRMDKSTVTYTENGTVWQWPAQSASTGSYTASAYYFQERVGEPDNLNLLIKLTPTPVPSTIVSGDDLTFEFADPGISHLNGQKRQVAYTHIANRNIIFIIPKSLALPRVVGESDTTLTGVNKVVEGRQFVLGKQYKINIEDVEVTSNLEFNNFIRQIPIFAFTQSASVNRGHDTKYVMAPGTIVKGQGNAVAISDSIPPNISTAMLFGTNTSNTSIITKMNDNGGYVRFYVAIVEYIRKTGSGTWERKWLQVRDDGKPFWLEAKESA